MAKAFDYTPNEAECEKASNGYLMSVIALILGLPIPIINLIATAIFFLGNRNQTLFVRWHTTQALLSQLTIFCMNAVGFSWTMGIIFEGITMSDQYIAYMITIAMFNLTEFIATIYTSVATRKGTHVELWFIGALTNLIYKRA